MYDKEFWDDIYRRGFIPWTDEYKDAMFVEKIIHDVRPHKASKILDYGCGDGRIGKYFLEHGLEVDFAEISSVQVEALKKELKNRSNIYLVEEPKDINKKYDIIICSGVLHHINPEKWLEFLQQFNGLLSEDGQAWICGFDKNDEVLLQNNGNAIVTQRHCWPIDELLMVFDSADFEVLSDYTEKIKIGAINKFRSFRFFTLKTTRYKNKSGIFD